MQVVFFGTPQFAVPTLQALLAHPEFNVAAVVTQPDKRRGRGKQLIPSAVKKVAQEHNLLVWQPAKIKKDSDIITQLKETQADVFVVVAYGQILSAEILAIPKLGCINVHGSLLPKYRGAAPIQWSLYNGDRETGITTMLMDEGMDTGAMLLKAPTPVDLLDNTHELAVSLAKTGADLLITTLLKLAQDDIEPIPQDDAQATYARLIQKSDYILDWSGVAEALHNQVRGFYPHCVTFWRGKQLKIIATIPLGEAYWSELPAQLQNLAQLAGELNSGAGNPGEVVSILKNWGPVVQTGQGLLLLQEVQMAGKRPQSAWDFVNGTRLAVGEKLGTLDAELA